MVKTIVKNDTPQAFTLKEGNAGVYRDIKVLDPEKQHTIELDTNATYREYVVVQNASGEKEYITSDDCLDNSKITIKIVDNKLFFEKVLRDTSSTSTSGGQRDGEGAPAHRGIFSRFVKMFK
jgi:hypothetical protein